MQLALKGKNLELLSLFWDVFDRVSKLLQGKCVITLVCIIMICDWRKHFPLIFQTNQYGLGLRTDVWSKGDKRRLHEVFTCIARARHSFGTGYVYLLWACVWFVGFSVFWRYKITTSLKYQIIVKKMNHTRRLVGIMNKSASKLIKASILSGLFLTISASGT